MFESLSDRIRARLADRLADCSHLLDRMLWQLDYARDLCRLRPDRAGEFQACIADAERQVEQAVARHGCGQLALLVEAVETTLAPLADAARSYTLRMVGHAHVDMNWQWGWAETVATTCDTLETALTLMDEFPDFVLMQSQASCYEIVHRYRPRLLKDIRRRIRQGRWDVTASHWVEGDKNLIGGESLARHLLYARRFTQKLLKLGRDEITVDFSPDTFGHALSIPMIDAAGGVRHYYLCRGGRAAKPPVFRWRSPDGSEVLALLELTWYNDVVGPHNASAMARFCEQTGLDEWLCVFGIGDHGGGPTRRDLRRIDEMRTWPIYPTIRYSTLHEYFAYLDARRDELPVVEAELNFEFPGCYTSQRRVKQTNRADEAALHAAEMAAVLAERQGDAPAGRAPLEAAWREVLLGHFHDILPGSGVEATRNYHLGQHEQTAAFAQELTTASLRAVARRIDTTFAGRTWGEELRTIWTRNLAGGGAGAGLGALPPGPHPGDWPRVFTAFDVAGAGGGQPVEVTLWEGGMYPRSPIMDKLRFVARFPDGSLVPAQRIGDGSYLGHRFVTVLVPVDIPAGGYASFAVEPAGEFGSIGIPGYPGQPGVAPVEGFVPAVSAGSAPAVKEVEYLDASGSPACGLAMENEHLAVRFDPAAAGIVSLVDKATGRDLADGANPMAGLAVHWERPGGMSSWKDWAVYKTEPIAWHAFGPGPMPDVRGAENRNAAGPHAACFQAKGKIGDADVTLRYVLRANRPTLEVAIDVDWLLAGNQGKGTPTLRLSLPTALRDTAGRYETPFGYVDRPHRDGETLPAGRWADITGTLPRAKGRAGLAVFNDASMGHRLCDGTLELTLLRSSDNPDPLPELGRHAIRLALQPHGAEARPADLMRTATTLHARTLAVTSAVHAGELPPAGGAATCDEPAVDLAGWKRAEDGSAVLFRLVNTAPEPRRATVALDPKLWGKVSSAVEVDLIEDLAKPNRAKKRAKGFVVDLAPRGIATVAVTFVP